ncbi:SLAP domain-containing protein [Oceanobacillus halotolerans]|uniref:SLAP domain-containing protein n=1 Tax=Oceanobacillus halotolerans TaxID=2663380 RepID=UPI0013D7D507|nr:SLAP domain-containing protein [Oceanobacillus halotolerans]
MKKVLGIIFISFILFLAACSNDQEVTEPKENKDPMNLKDEEMIEIAQDLQTTLVTTLFDQEEEVDFASLEEELYIQDATINPELSTYEEYTDLNSYDISLEFEEESVELQEEEFSYNGTMIETYDHPDKTYIFTNEVELTIHYDEEAGKYKISEQDITRVDDERTYATEQPIVWTEEQLEINEEDDLKQVQYSLNELGDVEKDAIAINGRFQLDSEGKQELVLQVFIRNGYDVPIYNINGDIDVVVTETEVDENGEEIEVETPIASAYFDLSNIGTIPAGSTKWWSIRYAEDYLLVDINNYDLNKEHEYTITNSLDYSY